VSVVHRIAVRRKFYLDSVALMRSSKSLAALPDVVEAAMMMGTPANTDILQNAGLLTAAQLNEESIGAGDLVIGIRAINSAAAGAALTIANELLDSSTTPVDAQQWRPRSIRGAMVGKPQSNFALISVPGAFAISEARKAVRNGLHTMIFSDNVPLAQEVALKQEASALGKLVMGPDCGTAIINGVPLAFANKVPRGPVGLVGASGTGMQEVSCLLAQSGVGISQAVGVGGRDLTDAVGGVMSMMALKMLIADPATQHVVLISKPASQSVVEKITALLATTNKTVTLCFLGGEKLSELPANCEWTTTLQEATAATLTCVGAESIAATISNEEILRKATELALPGQLVRGLFCGGTLCMEAQLLFSNANVQATSNVPVDGERVLDPSTHTLIDLGDDEYTRGKPHPMIDPSSRDAAVHDALQDDRVAVLLVDVVIGYGSHANPARQFVECLQRCESHATLIIASVTGTEDDPQCLSAQRATLAAAGVVVASSNSQAASLALTAIGHPR